MKRRFDIFCLSALAVILASCAGRGRSVSEARPFPQVSIPSVYTEQEERMEYVLNHYWDDFRGVPMGQIEIALSNFIGILDNAPLDDAQKAMELLFDRICAAERADTSAHRYVLMTQLVSRYLYDPNSPMRNEDYYLPFVRLMAESPLTAEELRPAYRYEAESCAICRRGTAAPDFKARTAAGEFMSLYGVKADYTMLFFSNPGCEACKEIVDEITAVPEICRLTEEGTVAVVNVYIDEDLAAWREYLPNYPEKWINCHDSPRVIRDGRLYDVRAIPSLYLLDRDKKILLKDAPTQKVIAVILNQNIP